MEHYTFARPNLVSAMSSSDDDDVLVVDGSTSRHVRRYQFLAEDMAEVLEGDFLAVKPGWLNVVLFRVFIAL